MATGVDRILRDAQQFARRKDALLDIRRCLYTWEPRCVSAACGRFSANEKVAHRVAPSISVCDTMTGSSLISTLVIVCLQPVPYQTSGICITIGAEASHPLPVACERIIQASYTPRRPRVQQD